MYTHFLGRQFPSLDEIAHKMDPRKGCGNNGSKKMDRAVEKEILFGFPLLKMIIVTEFLIAFLSLDF